MADPLLEADIALGLVEPTATPIATPVPIMSPAATPELSFLERMRQSSYAVPQPFRALGDVGLSLLENPRVIPEEGASIAGSVVGSSAGAALGLPLAPVTGGLSVPVGSILGGALGSYADVPVQMGLDYLLETTPTQSRVSQATQEAALGAGLETGLRGLGWLGKTAVPIARKASSVVSNFLGPSTVEDAQRLVGSELAKAITPQELIQAAAEKEALGNVGEALTTADVTGSKQLARMQTLLSGQDLGQANITFAETAAKQLDDLDQAAFSLTELKDPNPKRAGEAAKTLLTKARENEFNSAGALFTDEVRAISAPVKGIADEVNAVEKEIFKDSKVLGPSGEIQGLINQIQDLEKGTPPPKTPAGFGREAPKAKPAPTQTTVGTLQDLRSKALEIARNATDGSRDELVADRLVELLGKRIDNIEGTQSLKEARAAWRKAKQTWYKDETGQMAPLARLLRKQSPEDIIADVSKKSAVSDDYARILGGLEPNKLATEMADFVQQKTVDEKLEWLRSKRAIFVDSPIAPVLQQWEDALTKIQNTAEAAKVKGLSANNINTQATSLIRALGGTGREALASGAEAGAMSATRNIARSGITSALGGAITGFAAAVTEPLVRQTLQESTAKTASALAQALSDPSIALKYIDDAAKYGKEEAARIALQDQKINNAMTLVQSLAPASAATLRSSGLIDNKLQASAPTPTPTMTQAQVAPPDALSEAEALLSDFDINSLLEAPASEPTPQAETVKIGKQEVSIPVGKDYTDPEWVKAVMQVESSNNPNAVSPKGAGGLMQIMPATAIDLGLTSEQRFDPNKNVEAGSRYLKQLENQIAEDFGVSDKKLALAAYNWGIGRVTTKLKELKDQGKQANYANLIQFLPTETRNYVRRVQMKYNLIKA